MPTVHPIQDSFNAGEWSPKMLGQVGLDKYRFACKRLENFIPLLQGPAQTRGGLKFIHGTKLNDTPSVLRPFIFSDDQAFILEFGHHYLRFYTNQQIIMTVPGGSTPYELATPYNSPSDTGGGIQELKELQFVQSFDVMYILHPSHPPMKLSHYGLRSWTLELVEWNDGPYLDEDLTNLITLSSSETTGTTTITASDDVFERGHVGSTWRIRHSGGSETTTFTSVTVGSSINLLGSFVVDITVTTDWVGRIVLQESVDGGTTWFDCASFLTSTKQQFYENRIGVYYRLNCVSFSTGSATAVIYQTEHWGVFKITAYGSPTSVTATILSAIASTDPTPLWREAAWSDVRGYPRTACFRDERLWLFGTPYQPLGAWGSWVGDFENFSPGDTEDAPVTEILADFEGPIQWALSYSVMFAGTIGEEARLATRKQDPISSTNPFSVDIQSAHGTAKRTRPIRIGSTIVFVQQGRRKIRAINYEFVNDTFQAEDLTVLADHITKSGILDTTYQKEPNSMLWCQRIDGQLAGLTYYPKEKVLGWCRLVTDGLVESDASIPSSFGDTESRNELWATVRRTVNGQTVRYVELLADFEGVGDQSDYFCVDSGIVFESGEPANMATGLAHLEGKTVSIFADGAPQAQQVISGGRVPLDPPAMKAIIGLPYRCVLETMDFEAGTADGTSQARMKEIEKVTVRVLDTLLGKIGPDEDNLIPISTWVEGTTLLGQPVSGRRADIETDGWPGNSEKKATVMIVIDQPVPATVLAIMPVITTND